MKHWNPIQMSLQHCETASYTALVTAVKIFHIMTHINSETYNKRRKQLKDGIKPVNQSFFDNTKPINKFTDRILDDFLDADIPLYKTNNRKIKDLFKYMRYPIPSEATLRKGIISKYEKSVEEIKLLIKDC